MTIRVNDFWKRKGCAFWVGKRQYGAPGPCENRRDVRPVMHAGAFALACGPHRAMVERGHAMRLTKDVQAESARQLRTMARFRRAVALETAGR